MYPLFLCYGMEYSSQSFKGLSKKIIQAQCLCWGNNFKTSNIFHLDYSSIQVFQPFLRKFLNIYFSTNVHFNEILKLYYHNYIPLSYYLTFFICILCYTHFLIPTFIYLWVYILFVCSFSFMFGFYFQIHPSLGPFLLHPSS